MRSFLVVSCLVLVGCESGVSRSIDVTVPAEVTARFSPASPGVVVADVGGEATGFLVLCGDSLPNPLELSQDLGFGCVGQRVGTEETIRVWVQPLNVPAGPDAGIACASSRSFYGVQDFSTADGGTLLAAGPETGWAQGSGSGKWRRDLSPCGGVLNVSVTLAP